MKHFLTGFGLFLVFICNGLSQNNRVFLPETDASWIESEYVKDSFLIECYIPNTVSKSRDSLPIIVVLDADMSFAMTYDIVNWLRWSKEIPDVAIVGIAYGKTQADWWEKRSRDYTTCRDETELWGKWDLAGGGENFIKFIEFELFPYLKNTYELKCTDRTIVGLSFGGLIATDILLSRTELFNRYITAGPALIWNNKEIFKREENYGKTNTTLNAIVYTSIGSLDDKSIVEPWREFNDRFIQRKYEKLDYKTEIIENETHISMFPAALTKGLIYVLNQPKH